MRLRRTFAGGVLVATLVLAGSVTASADATFLGPISTVRVGDKTIAYRQFGRGPDLLMIAGQASSMGDWPLSTLETLARSHRVTIYDNRDLGDSSDTTSQFQLTDLADDAHQLITTLGLKRPAVFGWSTGGEIGLLLAVRHPAALSKLAITGATPGGRHSALPPSEVIALFADPNPDPIKQLDVLFSPAGGAAQRKYLAGYAQVQHSPPAPDATAKYDAAEKQYWSAPEPDLRAIRVPVLVMNGQADYAVPPGNAKYIARRIGRRAQLVLDRGGRHAWFAEHSTRFDALMRRFLASQ